MALTRCQLRSLRKKQAAALKGGDQSTTATDATAMPTLPQEHGNAPILQSNDELGTSPWFPELSEENRIKAIEADRLGNGAMLKFMKSIDEQRLEMRAVNERWPIPAGLKQKMIIEAYRTMTNSSIDIRNRLMANRLLITMDSGNRTAGLPDQVQGTTINNVTNIGMSISDFVQGIQSDKGAIDALDFREFKPVEGSADDYAE